MPKIRGASVGEQRLYDHLCAHVDNELEVLKAYDELASTSESKAFKFLAGLILDDERRHHKVLNELAESVRTSAELTGEPTPIPALDFRDREAILAATERFLALEEEDDRELKAMAKELKDLRDTTLWHLVLELIQADNEKHRRILRFIRDRAKSR